MRNGGIGDTILLSSVLQQIRRQYPDDWIEVMGVKERVDLLVGEGLADRAISGEFPGVESLYTENETLHPQLHHYLESFDRIVWYTARQAITMEKRIRIREDQVIRVHPALPAENDRSHITEFYCNALKGIIDYTDIPPSRIAVTRKEKESAQTFLREMKIDSSSLLMAMHVGAGNREKQAPVELFLRCADFFRNRMPVEILLTKGPADHEAVEDFRVKSNLPVHILDQSPLITVAHILSCCDLFIGNDSGITHIAAAVQCPTLAFFIISDPNRWKPRGDHVCVIQWDRDVVMDKEKILDG